MFKNLIPITKINWVFLFRETISVYSECHIKSTNTICDQNTELLNIKVGYMVHIRYHRVLDIKVLSFAESTYYIQI
jgi:hypothetical protein